jgi:hypothetical protein
LGAHATRNLGRGGRVRMASPPAPMTDGEVIQVCNPVTCSCRARWRGCGRPGMAGSRLAGSPNASDPCSALRSPRPCPVRRGLRCRPSAPPSDGSLSRPGTRLGRPPDRDPGRSRLHRRPLRGGADRVPGPQAVPRFLGAGQPVPPARRRDRRRAGHLQHDQQVGPPGSATPTPLACSLRPPGSACREWSCPSSTARWLVNSALAANPAFDRCAAPTRRRCPCAAGLWPVGASPARHRQHRISTYRWHVALDVAERLVGAVRA